MTYNDYQIFESKVRQIAEAYYNTDTYPSFIRHQLKSIYSPLSLWGKAPNPNDDCNTNEGVINIFPHSPNDVWSVLNRFDTNTKVKKRIRELFSESKSEGQSDQDFNKWIEENKDDLFGPKGKYTQELVDLNMGTIISGNRNEEYSIEKLKEKFPNTKIKRFCSGDIRDTKKGIDISIEHPDKTVNVQVKPYIKVASFVEDDGDTFYEVTSYLDVNKYSDRNVDIFMFVNVEENKFILFKNTKTKIGQMRNNIIRFYDPSLYTNIVFEKTQKKRKNKSSGETYGLFGVNNDLETLKNLEFRKTQIEKLINKVKKRLEK